jgi:hypothetical protein
LKIKEFDMVDEQELKVVDKRSQQSDSATSSQSFNQTEPTNSGSDRHEDSRPMDFASFTVGLATQAMMLLGEIPEPQSGKLMPTNLAGARQTIDIISLLQEKTKGNLTPDEDKLIQDVLTSLRIEFVKKAKK